MQKAFEGDMAMINQDGTPDYIDNAEINPVIDVTDSQEIEQSEPVGVNEDGEVIESVEQPSDEDFEAAFFAQ